MQSFQWGLLGMGMKVLRFVQIEIFKIGTSLRQAKDREPPT